MKALRTAVVALVIAAIFSPAMGMAKTEPRTPVAPAAPVAAQRSPLAVALTNVAVSTLNAQKAEAAQYAQREQQSQGVRDFRGGAVYVYFGSGVVLALIIIILIPL